jgi:hypothetical protein
MRYEKNRCGACCAFGVDACLDGEMLHQPINLDESLSELTDLPLRSSNATRTKCQK